jgi:hypothetical protein
MPDPQELELVHRAIKEARTTTDCCEWDAKAASRVERDIAMETCKPARIKQLLIDFVLNGGIVEQVPETRDDYSFRKYFYKAILPVSEFRHGLFVEIVLINDDPELPGVLLVNAHEQNR